MSRSTSGAGPFLVLLAPILLLGAYLRLSDLGGPSLWLDEILHLQIAESLADEPWYRHLLGVRESRGGAENGALYYRLQIWGLKLAPGEVGARLFPAAVGILTLPLMTLVGYRLGGRLVALAATFLLAVSPLHVYFSREGRPYSLLTALALLLLYALLHEGSRAGVRMAYLGCVLAAYVGLHSVPVLLSFAILSAIFLGWSLAEGRGWRRSAYLHYLAAASLALGLAYGLYMTGSHHDAPALDDLQRQAGLREPSQEARDFLSPLSARSLEIFLAGMTTSGHPSVPMGGRAWVLIALSAVGAAAAGRRRPRKLVATAGAFLLPAALSVAALAAADRWYGMRYATPALPAFLLLVAVGIAAAGGLAGGALAKKSPGVGREAVAWATAGLVLWLFVAPSLAAARADPYRKLDWRGVARFFDAVAIEGEPVLVPDLWPQICLDYYLRELGREVEFVRVWRSTAIAGAAVEERPTGWLLAAGFPKAKELRAWMRRFVPVLQAREEEMELWFFPDFATFLETRFAARKGAVFERRFAEMGQRFDFDGAGSLLQGRGWSYPERNRRGDTFQWAVGEQAELGLPVGRPRDASLRFRALPYAGPGAAVRRLELWLDGTLLAVLDLPPRKWSEHRVEVPASSWGAGADVLYLRFDRGSSPAASDPASGDPRDLAVAFDYLEVVGSRAR